MRILKELLYTSDLFGVPVSLNFYGRAKSKSNLGGICSLFLIAFNVWAFYTATKDMFGRTNPNTTSSEFYQDDPPEMSVHPNNFPIAFKIQNSENEVFIDDSIYQFTLKHVIIQRITHQNGTIENKFTTSEIQTERCTAANFGDLAPRSTIALEEPALCIALDQPNLDQLTKIQGVYGSAVQQFLYVQISGCENNTISESSCAPSETIEYLLAGASFIIVFPDMVIDPQNFDNPDARFQDTYVTLINPIDTKEVSVGLGHFDVVTDSGWLMEDKKTQRFINVNRVTETSQPRPESEKTLISCVLHAHKLASQYSRRYKKIQDALAELGGLANTAFLVLAMITTPYFQYKYREALMNELFDVIQPAKKSKKKKSSKNNNNTNLEINKAKDLIKSDHTENYQIKINESNVSPDKIDLEAKIDKQETFNNRQKYNPNLRYGSLPNISQLKSTFASKLVDNKHKKRVKSELKTRKSSLDISLEPTNRNTPLPCHLMSYLEKPVKIQMKELKEPEIEYPSFILPDSISAFTAKSNPRNQISSQKLKEKDRNSSIIIETNNKIKCDGISAEYNFTERRHQLGENSEKEMKLDVCDEKAQEAECEDEEKISESIPQKCELTFWEYICSFIYRTKYLKEKIETIDEGINKVDLRLDIVNIMKKLQEFDKLRAITFDHDQLTLFNNLPKPRLIGKSAKSMRKSFNLNSLLRKATLNEEYNSEMPLFAYKRIKAKKKKTKLDQKILAIYIDKN